MARITRGLAAAALTGAVALVAPATVRAESKVSLVPAAGVPGTQALVAGSGFGQRDRVTVRAGGRHILLTRTTRQGSFRARVRIPSGHFRHLRVVSRSGGRRIVNVFHRSVASDVGEIASRRGRRLRWTPVRGVVGSAVNLEGSGFPRGRRLRVRFGPAEVATPRADREGRVSTPVTVPSFGAGPRFVRVTGGRVALGFPFTVLRLPADEGVRGGAAAAEGSTPPPAGVVGDPVIAAAGDIACSSSSSSFNGGRGKADRCRQRYTSDLLVNQGLAAVVMLGDAQYENGTLSGFRKSYDLSWGRVKSITRPVAGNHEYKTTGAAGYYDYFNGVGVRTGPAGDRSKGYYSFNVGTWHLIALNSTDHCTIISCSAGSAQERWLKADLAANADKYCTLAFWHDPRFNSGHDGNGDETRPLFQALYDANADVVLGGHAHDYERFAPQNPSGQLDNTRGIRQFVIGTGGAFFTGIGTPKRNSQVRQNSTYGILKLTLRPASYEWRFVPEAGKSFRDSGVQACH